MTDLFSVTARHVAQGLNYVYNFSEEKACKEFLDIVHDLPKDAEEIKKPCPLEKLRRKCQHRKNPLDNPQDILYHN